MAAARLRDAASALPLAAAALLTRPAIRFRRGDELLFYLIYYRVMLDCEARLLLQTASYGRFLCRALPYYRPTVRCIMASRAAMEGIAFIIAYTYCISDVKMAPNCRLYLPLAYSHGICLMHFACLLSYCIHALWLAATTALLDGSSSAQPF